MSEICCLSNFAPRSLETGNFNGRQDSVGRSMFEHKSKSAECAGQSLTTQMNKESHVTKVSPLVLSQFEGIGTVS